MRFPLSSLLTLVLLLLAGGSLTAGELVIISDDFNDDSLDSNRWRTMTSDPQQSGADVREIGGQIELTNRGYLVSAAAIDLEPQPATAVRVRGIWTFTNASWPGHDFLTVVTRTDADPYTYSGEVRNGVGFMINGDDFIRLQSMVDGVITNLVPDVPLLVDDGDSFFFELFDNGQQVTFNVLELGGQGASAQAAAPYGQAFSTNSVAFYNREYGTGYLDNVLVTRFAQVPEPSTGLLALLGLTGLAWAGWSRRSRNP